MRHNISLADDSFKRAFVAGEFFIDCVEIALTRNGPGSPAGYVSRGSLAVTPAQGATARLVVPKDPTVPSEPFASFLEGSSLTLGQMVPDHHYFALKATDTAGNVWTHPSAQVVIVEESPVSSVLTVKCAFLRLETTLAKAEAGISAMVFMEDLPFPDRPSIFYGMFTRAKRPAQASRKASIGKVAGLAITFDHRAELPGPKYCELFVENEEMVALEAGFDDRMLEAARFCTATIATPVMRETILGDKRVVELARFRSSNKGDLIQPPLFAHGHEAEFHKLMERYFEYARHNAEDGKFSPLSVKISGIFALEGVFIDTVALLVAVTVESVLGEDVFAALGKPDASALAQVDKLISHTKTATGVDPKLIDRGVSAVGSMKATRAVDKLHALAVAGTISDDDRTTWKRLRDIAAHGSFEVDPAKIQKLYDDVYRLSTLVYKLSFLRIGYAGKFSNRAAHGWPVHDFPPRPATAPPAPAGP